MTYEQIEKVVESKPVHENPLKIHFKTRNSIVGLFVQTGDYEDLKAKNFWRIVSGGNIDLWKKTNNNDLAKIFNGSEITKLTDVK
jgi:hypothetical protein